MADQPRPSTPQSGLVERTSSPSRDLLDSSGSSNTSTPPPNSENLTTPSATPPSSPPPPSASNPSSLWIISIAVVNFDLEYGQKIESLTPQVSFPDEILNTIAFSSFPDCTITERNTIFTFRCPRSHQEPKKWMYGYVFYRQSKDSTIHRGYLQKSVAILSENNLVEFYQRVVAVIGEMYFEYGEKALETAWRDIAGWPQPQLSQTLSFPLLGKVLKYPMPSIRNGSFIFTPLPSVLETSKVVEGNEGDSSLVSTSPGSNGIFGAFSKSSKTSSSVVKRKNYGVDLKIPSASIAMDSRFLHTVPLYGPLLTVSSKLWLLWELVMIGQPIVVLSPSPTLSSDAVLSLASIISPLEYKGDFRPFFTIQDSDFKLFSDDSLSIFTSGTKEKDKQISSSSSKSSSHHNQSSSHSHHHSNHIGTHSSSSHHHSHSSTQTSHGHQIAPSSTSSSDSPHHSSWVNGLIVGGTNPYFSKALSHWNNIITLSGSHNQQQPSSNSNSSHQYRYKFNQFHLPTVLDAEMDQSANRSVGLIEYADHVQAKGYQTVFPPGVEFKKYMKKPSKDDTLEECHSYNEKFVRYHFHLRTTTFLAPLRHFFDRLVASKVGHFKPLAKLPLVGELNDSLHNAIVSHLTPARGSIELKFYETFIETATFKRWFNRKRSIANEKIASDYTTWLSNWRHSQQPFDGLGEMDLVNLYQDATEQLKREGEILGSKGNSVLKAVMEDIVKRLDTDLQKAIRLKELSGSSSTKANIGGRKAEDD